MSPKEQRARLHATAEKLAEQYPAEDKELFVATFIDVWTRLEEAIEDRLLRLDVDASPLVEGRFPYQPTVAAGVMTEYVKRVNNIVSTTVNNLLAVHPPAVRVEMLDAITDSLGLVRAALVDMDQEVIDRAEPPS